MHNEEIFLFSEGMRLEGVLRTPEEKRDDRPLPVIVNPPGTLGLAYGPPLDEYHERLVDGGYAVLSVNYRGYGKSEGERGWFHPWRDLEDMVNAVTFVETRSDLDSRNIFCFGQGGTGAGNALLLAAMDPRIRGVAVQAVFSDGAQWLRNMRTESDWQAYRRRIAENERRLVRGEQGEMVEPREEIVVATPERRKEKSKEYWDSKITWPFHLASAAKLMRYRPIDYARLIAPRPLLLFGVEDDVVTPTDFGAKQIYDHVDGPKKLVMQCNSTVNHYEAFAAAAVSVCAETIAWFEDYRSGGEFESLEDR